jgi:hypothetical protein
VTGPIDAGPIDTGPIDAGPIQSGPIQSSPITTRQRPVGGSANRIAWRRAGFLLAAGLALLAGLDAALLLLGLPAPVSAARLPEVHGMLLVVGFVGTLISLERAVASKHPGGFGAPALLGAGAVVVVSPAPLWLGQLLWLVGAALLVVLYVPLWRRQRDEAVLVQALGAVLLVGALVLWLGGVPVPHLLPWLVGFVVLTIAGERLELARITMGENAGRDLVVLSGLLAAAIVAGRLWPITYPVLGLALLGLVGWLAVHDVARHTIRSGGLPRFSAACLLAGYCWLGVASLVWTVRGAAYDGARYDAVVHAVFLGFTISMIMAHAPVILPAILRHPLPYHPAFIAGALLLQLSLVLRLWIGDGLGVGWAWQSGGALNIVSLLGFILTAVWSALRARTQRRRTR